METKAKYVLVGFCTLLAIVISFGLLMFSLNKGDREKLAYYSTVFTGGVAGLSQGNDVRFNGIKVGEVRSFTIDPTDPSRVRVVMSVHADTPVREDSEASLNIQGITGQAVVDITGGSASSPTIPPGTADNMRMIRSKRSPLSSFVNEAPQLITQANELLARGREVFSPENLENISSILRSLAVVSESLERQNGNIESTIENLAQVSVRLNEILGRADKISTDFDSGLLQFTATVKSLQNMIDETRPGMRRITGSTADELQRLLNDAQILVRNMNTLVNNINSNPQRFFFGDNVPGYSIK